MPNGTIIAELAEGKGNSSPSILPNQLSFDLNIPVNNSIPMNILTSNLRVTFDFCFPITVSGPFLVSPASSTCHQWTVNKTFLDEFQATSPINLLFKKITPFLNIPINLLISIQPLPTLIHPRAVNNLLFLKSCIMVFS